MDYSLPGSSIHGILQARILKRVAISSSRGSSKFRDGTRVSCIAGRFFTVNYHAGGLLVFPKQRYVLFPLGYMISVQVVRSRSQSSLYHCPFLPCLVQALFTSVLPSPSGRLCGVAGKDDHTLRKKRKSSGTSPP